jgi:hypothetical protein
VVLQVVTSARANAIHNFGMDKDRLIVGEFLALGFCNDSVSDSRSLDQFHFAVDKLNFYVPSSVHHTKSIIFLILFFAAEAFVGKDKYLKRLRIHGKGKAGQMVRPRCRLTVIVKELSAEKEAELARIRVNKYHSKKIRGSLAKLMPHRVLATQWQWSRKPRKGSVSVE